MTQRKSEEIEKRKEEIKNKEKNLKIPLEMEK